MQYYLCYTGLKPIIPELCPPTPASNFIRNSIPKEFYTDENNVIWRYTGDRYNHWPIYAIDSQ
jgi:hypothetical protein